MCLKLVPCFLFFFFFNDTATTEIYTLSLHDALPIYLRNVVPGQLHERVVKISSSRLNVRDVHSDPRERVDDGRCEVAGTDDGNVGFFPLYLFHARYCIQCLVVYGLGRNKAHPLSSRLCRDDFGRVQHYELSVVDEGEAVAQSLSFVHEVRHEYHGCAVVPDVLDECPRLASRLRVEPSGQFIQNGNLGVSHQGERYRQSLLPTTRQFLVCGILDVADPKGLEHAIRVCWVRIERGEEPQRFPHFEARRHRAFLELNAEKSSYHVPVLQRREPVDTDLTGIWHSKPADAL